MARQRKPWGVVMEPEALRFCVYKFALEILGPRFLGKGAAEVLDAIDQSQAPAPPTERAASLIKRSLRLPYHARRQWVADRATGDIAGEVRATLVAMIACTCYKHTCVVEMAWVPDLKRALRGSSWTRIEDPSSEQYYASFPRLNEQTLREWLKLGGHPDLGRYLSAYLASRERPPLPRGL